MVKDFRKLWETNAIWVVLISAAFFRLLAAIFSAGYAFSDDHFVVIEVAQRWVEGQNEWFDQGKPIRRSILYPGLHYILFYGLEQLNITDPQTKMLITRFFHAVYSMLIVIFGYLVTLHSSGPRAARQAGMILALFWILPFMSVRNLVE
ncbi:MAG: hypothetical protein GWN00_14985, partial [Aliifodinibius sp.]|nr:hypothetical protein [Fodinibius sp.]NIV12397.1 hypothetical protein [Fodinibius sp.]NIY26060.1 hypothetical protein [Fodinibius sp.]